MFQAIQTQPTKEQRRESRYWVFGRCHPRTDGGYQKKDGEAFDKLDDFTAEEIHSMNATDSPMRLAHNDNITFGKSVDHFTGVEGAKYIWFYIDKASPIGRYAKLAIKSGTDRALSIKHKVVDYMNGRGELRKAKELVEISLVDESRFDETCTVLYGIDDKDITEHITKGI